MELNIFAMRRSGQHAIINWICEQNKPCVHHNSCNIDTRNPRKFSVVYSKEGKEIVQGKSNSNSLLVKNYENRYIRYGLDNKERKLLGLKPINFDKSKMKPKKGIDLFSM